MMRKAMLCFVCFALLAAPAFARESAFPDVPRTHWAYAAVQELAAKKIVKGEPDGKFKGNKPVTRFELAVTLAKFLKYLEIRERQGKAAADKAPLDLGYKPLEATVERLQGTEEIVIDKGWRDGIRPESTMAIRRQGRDVGEVAIIDVQERKSVAVIAKAPRGITPGDRLVTKPISIHPTRTGGKPLPKKDSAYQALVWLVSWGYVPSSSKLLVDGDKPVTADETGAALGRAISRFIEKGDVVGEEGGPASPRHEHPD